MCVITLVVPTEATSPYCSKSEHFRGSSCRRKPCAHRVFFPFLEQHFPHLVRRYRERFEKSAYLKGHYPEALSARVEKLVSRYGLAPRDAEELPSGWPVDPQMGLFG